MRKFVFIILLSLFNSVGFSQVKIWNNNYKSVKVKGTYLFLSLEKPPEINKNLIGATTIAGTLLPNIISLGNNVVKKATERKEENYKHEEYSLNQIQINSKDIDKKSVILTHFFIGKEEKANKYRFNLEFKEIEGNPILVLKLDTNSLKEDISTVKLKKKYDLVKTEFIISIQTTALKTIKKDNIEKKVLRILDLGSQTINMITPSFKDTTKRIISNDATYIIPSYTDKLEKIEIIDFYVSIKMKKVNPFGLTDSALNEFLETNSDINENLLKILLIKNEEE